MTTTPTVEERIEELYFRLSGLSRHDALRRQRILLRLNELKQEQEREHLRAQG